MILRLGLIEDEKRIRQGWKNIIEKGTSGFQVVFEADDGIDGLNKTLELVPDIIVTDIKMPRLFGLDMIETIRKSFPEIMILIISGYDDFDFMRKALQERVDDYLLKPVKRLAFLKVLEKFKQRKLESRRGSVHSGTETSLTSKVKDEIQAHLSESLSLKEIAHRFNVNYSHLSSKFKSETGLNFSAYVNKERMAKARDLLKSTNLYVYEVAKYCGFDNEKYFVNVFKRVIGQTPKEYRNSQNP